MNDIGSSSGEFAMESEAFRRFATVNGIRFEATPFDGDESLMVVEVEGARYPDDDYGEPCHAPEWRWQRFLKSKSTPATR